MARPLVAPSRARSHVVAFRLTGDEHARLAATATAAGVSVAELARAKALGGRAVAALTAPAAVQSRQDAAALAALRYEVNAVGVNLNQIARHLHMSGEPTPAEVRQACRDVSDVLRKLLASDAL